MRDYVGLAAKFYEKIYKWNDHFKYDAILWSAVA